MVRAYLDKAPCAARVGFTDSREKRESGVGASNCPDTYMRDLVCLCAGRYTLARLLGRTSTPISAVTGRGPRHRPAGEEQVARFLRPRWPLSRTTLLCFEQLAAR